MSDRIVVKEDPKMSILNGNPIIKILVTFSFLLMIAVNALANILPINGLSTGDVSDAYANLFAPAGVTFAIWGLIYLFLAAYTLYQMGIITNKSSLFQTGQMDKIGFYFSLSSLANAAWIFAWHYRMIPLSFMLMVVILTCLILIVREINQARLTSRDKLFLQLPFSIYFGWITVATIANATVLLVSIGWNGFGLSEATWAVIMISVGLFISLVMMLKNKDIAYGLVIIWAYTGILIKHHSAAGFAGQYPEVIITVITCIILLLLAEAYILFSPNRKEYFK